MDEGELCVSKIPPTPTLTPYSVVIKPYRLDDLLNKIEEMMKIRATTAAAAAAAVPISPVLPTRDSVEAIAIDEESKG